MEKIFFLYIVSSVFSNFTSRLFSTLFPDDITSEMDSRLPFSLIALSSVLNTRNCSLGMYIEHPDSVIITIKSDAKLGKWQLVISPFKISLSLTG